MPINAVYALGHISRISIQDENGYSAVVRGGYTKTASMMMRLMPVAKFAPSAKQEILYMYMHLCLYRY